MCLPQDVAYGLPPAIEEAKEPAGYVKDLRQRLSEAHAVVRLWLQEVHKHQAHVYAMRAVPIVFEPGQLVWLLVPAIPVGTSAKFAR